MAKRVKIPGRLESAETGNIVTGADAVMDDAKGKTQVVINSEVDAAIINLAQGKQDNLTFDSAPTEDSPNPVTSAGVYTADKVLSDAIEAILLLIPSAASALNKLVDMQTMNSSIATATASFKGTYNLVSDLHLGVDATHEQIGAALDALSLDADNNDYAFVQVPNSATAPTEISKTERYKFNGENWLFEYDLNNSGFTSPQWNAINSGVTSLLVSKLSNLPTNAELTTLFAGKQDTLTFDNVPTAGSPKPVKSGGVYARNNEIVALINALDAAKQDVLTFDNAPVQGSPNPVKSGGVYTAISAVQAAIVALDAAKQNVLTFDNTPTLGSPNPVTSSGIKTELNRIDGNITTLNDLYEALTQSALVIIAPTDTWPVASPASKTIYRVVDRVNTPPQYYSDYMWNGTAMVLMATYDNAIDDVPTAGSNNLVKSGGVVKYYGLFSFDSVSIGTNDRWVGFSLIPYRGQYIWVKVTGNFRYLGYFKSDGSYVQKQDPFNVERPVKFKIPNDATNFFVVGLLSEPTTVKVEICLGYSYEVENLIKGSKFAYLGRKNAVSFDFTNHTFSYQSCYVSFGQAGFKYINAASAVPIVPRTDDQSYKGFWFLYFDTNDLMLKCYMFSSVPVDTSELYVVAVGFNSDIIFSTSSIQGFNNNLPDISKGTIFLVNDFTTSDTGSGYLFRSFSLIPYRGQILTVKATGVFTRIGYYNSDGYIEITTKSNYPVSFYVPDDATDFFIYSEQSIGSTTVHVEFWGGSLVNSVTNRQSIVFMSLGDSITTDSYYNPILRELLCTKKHYNLAVVSATWADKNNTIYDGNPVWNGPDNNENNVLGNQVQKIKDHISDYSEHPDVIIIAAGTNDEMPVPYNTSIEDIIMEVDNKFQNNGQMIPMTTPTFDSSDTYKEYRKTIAGAMRYCVCELQKLFPDAHIYILTPIQGCISRKNPHDIITKQIYITQAAVHLSVPVIHVGEECGIQADFEYEGAMWTAPTGTDYRSGRDLADGLHPNKSGSEKMAEYIAKRIINDNRLF